MSESMTQEELDKALWESARNGDAQRACELLERGAKVDAADSGGWRALHVAAWHDCGEVVELLLDRGARIDVADVDGSQPLHLAVWNGSDGAAGVLIARGTRIDAADNDGDQPLHLAVAKGRREIVKVLLAHGADLWALNKKDKTPHALCADGKTGELLEKAEEERKGSEEYGRKVLAEHRRRQRRLGSLRPKGPAL